MRKITKRSAAIIAASVIAVGAGAAAWAAVNGWDITGSGTATGKAASIVPMTASADMRGVKVYPGLVTTVTTLVTNANDFPVKLNTTAVQPTGVEVSGTPTAGACQTALASAPSTLTATYPAWAPKIAAHAEDQAVSADVAIANTLPQSCAGADIKVTYNFTGVSTV